MEKVPNEHIADYVISKIKTERIFRYCIITYTILLCAFSVVSLFDFSGKKMAIVLSGAIPLWIASVIYFNYYFPLLRSLKWPHTKYDNILREIKSRKAVFSTTPYTIIPYSQIAWVYLDYRFVGEDGESLGGFLAVHCKDGQKFKIESSYEFWYDKITTEVEGVIIGFGPDKRKQYLSDNPTAKIKHKRSKTIWGIILLLCSAGLTSLSIINKAIKPMGIVLIALLLIGGIFILMQGKTRK